MSQRSKIAHYIREYKVADMAAMMRNNSAEPLVCSADFSGRLVVITGATSGIGYATARKYASHGADLLCINRNSVKSDALCREIESEFAVRCNDIIADTSHLSDVRRVAQTLTGLERPIDVLIHNAGVYLTHRTSTVDGLESVFVVNYLSSFLLNYRLREKLRSQEAA